MHHQNFTYNCNALNSSKREQLDVFEKSSENQNYAGKFEERETPIWISDAKFRRHDRNFSRRFETSVGKSTWIFRFFHNAKNETWNQAHFHYSFSPFLFPLRYSLLLISLLLNSALFYIFKYQIEVLKFVFIPWCWKILILLHYVY